MRVEPIVQTSKLNPELGSSPIRYTERDNELAANGLLRVENKKPEVKLRVEPELYFIEVPVYNRKDNSPYEIYKENTMGTYLQRVRQA